MSHTERARARLRLAETPAPVDTDNLGGLEEEAAAIVRGATERRSRSSDELLTEAVDDVSRSYYRYLMRRHRGHTPPRGNS